MNVALNEVREYKKQMDCEAIRIKKIKELIKTVEKLEDILKEELSSQSVSTHIDIPLELYSFKPNLTRVNNALKTNLKNHVQVYTDFKNMYEIVKSDYEFAKGMKQTPKRKG